MDLLVQCNFPAIGVSIYWSIFPICSNKDILTIIINTNFNKLKRQEFKI